jgi:hypothetical protein
LAQNHSDEYTPPSNRVKSTPPQVRASWLISAASATAVWSFHSTNIASGSSSNPGVSASGRPAASASTGVEPVVSTAMPRTFAAAPGPAAASASRIEVSMLSR